MASAEDVSMFEIKCVVITGLKGRRNITRTDVRPLSGGGVYVKVDPRSHTLINLVTHDNPHAPSLLPNSYSRARSVGLSKLIQQRNAQQIQDLSKSSVEGCTLFDADPSNKRPRMERKAA